MQLHELTLNQLNNLIGTTIKCVTGTKTFTEGKHYILEDVDRWNGLLAVRNNKGHIIYVRSYRFSN